jgi:hypothetical protein
MYNQIIEAAKKNYLGVTLEIIGGWNIEKLKSIAKGHQTS